MKAEEIISKFAEENRITDIGICSAVSFEELRETFESVSASLKGFAESDIEKIAEAVHNAWWDEKKRQGITNHPDMIPYAELSENVKEYDRVTAKVCIDAMNDMTHPFIYIDTTGLQTDNPDAPKNRVPWFASQTDMLSEDWIIVE